MEFSLIAVVIAAIFPILTKFPVMVAMKNLGGYDNKNPREQQARLEGWGKRALAAHQNTFEAFPIFGICVLVAHFGNAELECVNFLCIVFLISRILYVGFYIADRSSLRSFVWFCGFLSSVGIGFTPLIH